MSRPPKGRALLWVAVLLAWHCGPPAERARTLAPGATVSARIETGQRHRYHCTLKSGQCLRLAVKQREQDLSLKLTGPQGACMVDGFTHATGTERLVVVAEQDSSYLVEIEMLDGIPGPYPLETAITRATEMDRKEARLLAELAQAKQAATTAAKRDHLHRAAALADEIGSAQHSAACKVRLGWLHIRDGDQARASAALSDAARLYQKQGDPAGATIAFSDLALLAAPGDQALARDLFAAARNAAERSGSRSLLARIELLEAEQSARWSDFSQGIALLEKAQTDLGQDWPGLRAEILGELAFAYGNCGRATLARELLLQSLELVPDTDRKLRPRLLIELGWSWYLEGEWERAVAVYTPLAQTLKPGDQGYAGLHDRFGSVLREAGRYREALAHFGLAARETQARSVNWAHIQANLSALHLRMEDPDAAIRCARAATEVFLSVDQPMSAANALKLEARALAKRGDRPASLASVEQAVALLEAVRNRITTPTQAYSLTSAQFDTYLDYLDVMLDSDASRYVAQSFELLEWVRSRKARSGYGQRESDPPTPRRLAELQRTLSHAETALEGVLLERLLERAEHLSARPARAPGPEPRRVDVATLQRQLLEPNDLLLSYCLGPTRSWLWLLDRSGIEVFALPPAQEIEFQVGQYVGRLTRLSQAGSDTTSAWGKTVSKLLLGPVRDRLGGKRLLLVKDGILHNLPFSALPDPGDTGRLLLEDHELVVLPSASEALLSIWDRAQRPLAERSALAIIDPVYDRSDPRLGLELAPREQGHALERLPGTETEANALQRLLPDTLVLRGVEANKQAVLATSLAQFRIVHFGVHGQLHERHPGLSRLELARFNAKGEACDGALRAQELAMLPMPVELAVLSGCKTAAGRSYRGDGLWSLGRDFMSAGAARVLVSLWDVDDHATAELMSAFYQNLLANEQRPSAALRAAQLKLRQHPSLSAAYFWAAFELQGNPRDWRRGPQTPQPARSTRPHP